MKTEWDYTALADAYLKRPDYSDTAIDAMLAITGVKKGDKVCDVGAGVAHLTLMLAAHGLDVTAIEPNDAMRANGISRTAAISNVSWFEGTGENTGQSDQCFDMVTFGSSFNVCDRPAALRETARILKPTGWFACMWNHRYLDDPIQFQIESIIRKRIPDYGYGVRREDQTDIIYASGLFESVLHIGSRTIHTQSIAECIEAWRSHATLERQAGAVFPDIVEEIAAFLEKEAGKNEIEIPYSTNIWVARVKQFKRGRSG
jgi:ubiquinone/menaquinone biosynthesis C-methylase UbiE